jgi:hypothetical protein
MLGGWCVLLAIGAQAFQEIAYRYWIPPSRTPQDDLAAYVLPVDRARAILVMAEIVLRVVPFVVIALRCFRAAPLAATSGLVFGIAFIGFEVSHRSLDLFMVGGWATQFVHASTTAERDIILQRFALWNEMARAWYFPLMLSLFLCSCSFALALWKDNPRNRWYWLASLAFSLNALRLVARLLSNFAGQKWLDGFNNSLYFPAVLIIMTLLTVWFFLMARAQAVAE